MHRVYPMYKFLPSVSDKLGYSGIMPESYPWDIFSYPWTVTRYATRAKGLSKMLRIVENERFTFDIDSENAILDCTLEH